MDEDRLVLMPHLQIVKTFHIITLWWYYGIFWYILWFSNEQSNHDNIQRLIKSTILLTIMIDQGHLSLLWSESEELWVILSSVLPDFGHAIKFCYWLWSCWSMKKLRQDNSKLATNILTQYRYDLNNAEDYIYFWQRQSISFRLGRILWG